MFFWDPVAFFGVSGAFPRDFQVFSRDPAIGAARFAITARSAAQRSVYSIYRPGTILFR